MTVQTKRIENPIYVITHIYSTGAETYGENVAGVYDSKTEAFIDTKNLVEEIAQKMKDEIGYHVVEVVEDEDTIAVKGKFLEVSFMELHRFRINTFDKNYLYVGNCIGLS